MKTTEAMTKLPVTNQAGFTLIELMIVITIIAILSAVAYPAYTQYVIRGKRAEGRAYLMDSAAIQERYYSDCNRYGGTIGSPNNCGTGTVKLNTASETGKYQIAISNLGALNQTFLLTASPVAPFSDPDCGSLTLDQAGTKGRTGTKSIADCWGK